MRIQEIENKITHGAGCSLIAKDTNRILLQLRSSTVDNPHTWGIWGGEIDNDESPEQTMVRESQEETGYDGDLTILPLTVHKDHNVVYHNHLVIIDKEFEPIINDETEDYLWTSLENIPDPMHYGLEFILSDEDTKEKVNKALVA